ncbi:MAG: extracellular solute-binding protein [Desulfobacteraceae bacterium]|nr:MAG: extracellular solute-binding protein [Desulfobacteraceae bacterium]
MKPRLWVFTAAVVVSILLPAGAMAEPIVINWWHAHGGRLGEKVNSIAENFNKSQNAYKVVAVYKGNYHDTMTAGIAAFRSKKPPHILQVFEVGTATMMAAKGAIKPVYEVMAESGLPFDPKAYLPTVTGYYSTSEGKMLSMPFNSSTPVLYYNIDAFKRAGLDPSKPPKTWPEVADYARKILSAYSVQVTALDNLEIAKDSLEKAGLKDAAEKIANILSESRKGIITAGFSSAWTSWIQIENFSAWHNVPMGTKANGFAGNDTEFVYNSPLHVRHIQQLADWHKEKIFVYGGRTNQGNAKFVTAEVAMYTESSAGYASFKANAKFEFATSTLPYWPDVKGAPQNTIIGGASLWVMAGHPKEEYKGVAAFFNYLASPEVQSDWHLFTGYLPITTAAYELTKKQGAYEKDPGMETALKQMTLHAPTENSMGIRFGNFLQVRDINDGEMEAIFAGKKTAKQGLDDAVAAGNKLLRKFEKANE